MLKKKPLSLAIAASLAAVSCQWMLASDVYAASTSTDANKKADNQTMEEVVVTGSRIQNPNIISASPITVISAKQIALQGTVRVEDMMGNIPSVQIEQGTGQANGSTGTATVDLRGLGAQRTLVLINGRRMPAGSPLQGGVGADINQIPAALIKNVQILTGGASATYGSDAVAGVVNFIMKDDFEGVQVDGQYSIYQHDNRNTRIQNIVKNAGFDYPDGSVSDGNMNNFSLIMGGNLDSGRGNVTAYVTYRKVQGVSQASRDYSACALNSTVTGCGGSGTSPSGTFSNFGGDPLHPYNIDYTVQGSNFVPNDSSYNYGPLNYFQRPDTRYTAGVFAHYDITDKVQAYMSVMGMDDSTVLQIAPSGDFFVTDTISCANPLLSAQQLNALCTSHGLSATDVQKAYIGRRSVEGGPRQQDLRYDSYRGVFGLRGNFNDTWRFDVYGQYSTVIMANTYYNDLGISKIKKALDVVSTPNLTATTAGQVTPLGHALPAPGTPICQSFLNDTDYNCVPWNIFQTGAVTKAMTDYLALPLYARGSTAQQVFSGYIEGNLGDYGIRLPTATDGVDLVLGAEYRQEDLDFSPDSGFTNGEGAGQGGATLPVHGSYNVKEYFTEANIPLVQGKAWAQDINLDVGYRFSDYTVDAAGSPTHQTNTYGIRTGWTINDNIKVRASYQRAVRAGNIRELFTPQGLNLFDMNEDPCGPSKTATAAQCANSGVTAAQYGNVPDSPAAQYNFLQGGNPDVKPEKADTYSFGFVLTPQFLDGMVLTVDYYNIKIKDGINNLDPKFILNQCLTADELCNFVKRAPSNGNLWVGSNVQTSGQIISLNNNLSVEKVDGVDISGDYTLNVGDMGSVNFHDVMNVVTKHDIKQTATAAPEHCKGAWHGLSCGYPNPAFRNVLRTTWNTPWNVGLSLNWRHISKVKDLDGDKNLGARDYFDLTGTWDVNSSVMLMVGANNLFDKTPPIAGDGAGPSLFGNGNIFPGMYDALGRYMFARIQYRH